MKILPCAGRKSRTPEVWKFGAKRNHRAVDAVKKLSKLSHKWLRQRAGLRRPGNVNTTRLLVRNDRVKMRLAASRSQPTIRRAQWNRRCYHRAILGVVVSNVRLERPPLAVKIFGRSTPRVVRPTRNTPAQSQDQSDRCSSHLISWFGAPQLE